ncbi:ankyrin repeat-containing domain protein [Morchella snyderi]|nr:ankyrin repeat-containing domain protein [Morchella snyderi]
MSNSALVDHKGTVKMLLDAGADTNTLGELGTALWAAAGFGSVDMFKMILDAGADVTIYRTEGGTALYAAAAYRERSEGPEIVNLLVDAGGNVDAEGGYHSTPLAAEAYRGSREMVEILLEAGADVDRQARGTSKPHWALKSAWGQGRADVVEFLQASGARNNIDGKYYGPPLSYAARWNHIGMAKMLLDADNDVNIPAEEYGKALCAAASEGHIEMLKIIGAAGVGVNIEVEEYGRALHIAARACRSGMLKVLLDYRADMNTQVEAAYGIALRSAVNDDDIDAVKLLLEASEGLNIKSVAYSTALYAAARCRFYYDRDIGEMIIAAVADANTRGDEYGPALHAAISGGIQGESKSFWRLAPTKRRPAKYSQ